jgi:hypothetical protein
MRYAGGMLGGTWMSSLASDLGDGVFDGAYLVENFENLNPANTFWDKYYHLYANVDTEPPRFLEFERWWGGFYLMNREEIEWITRNLFVGNKLWKGERGPTAARSICATSRRRSSCSRRWATTSRRRSRRSTGSRTSTVDRRDQGARAGDRRAHAREAWAPRHLRVGKGREEGASRRSSRC